MANISNKGNSSSTDAGTVDPFQSLLGSIAGSVVDSIVHHSTSAGASSNAVSTATSAVSTVAHTVSHTVVENIVSHSAIGAVTPVGSAVSSAANTVVDSVIDSVINNLAGQSSAGSASTVVSAISTVVDTVVGHSATSSASAVVSTITNTAHNVVDNIVNHVSGHSASGSAPAVGASANSTDASATDTASASTASTATSATDTASTSTASTDASATDTASASTGSTDTSATDTASASTGNLDMSNPTPTDITTGGVDPVPTDSHTYTVNGNSADYGWGLTQDGQGVVVWKGDWFQILSQGTSIAFNDQTVSTDYLFSGGAANNGSGSTVNHADNNSHGPILPAPAAEHQMEHIKATIVGADSLKEGETQSYKIQLSQAAEHDTYYTINVQDGSAHWVNGNTPGVDHQDIMWGGHFSVNIGVGPHAMHLYDVYGQVPNSTDANAGYRPAVGPSDASWDFSTFQNGQATGNTIVVKVPAGQTCSDSFDIKSWNEKITVDNQISDASAGQQGDEHFSLQIGQITGAGDCEEICGDGKGVTIQHNSEIHHVSPIALDLNGDGKIGVTGQTTSIDKSGVTSVGHTVSFDIDGDGVKDQIEWLDGMSDGLLVDMTKVGTDGSIDGKALFGDEGGKYANGYEKLALHDANGDGVISGEELKGLGIWIDNGDAVLQAGEMKSAAELHITSISADMHITYDNSGHALMQSAANIDGKTVLTEDVWFAKTDAAAHSPADVAKAVDPVHAIDDHHQDLAHAA